MKKMLLMGLMALALSGAYAQKGRTVVVVPRTVYVGSSLYSPYYSPYYSSLYSPFYSPFGWNNGFNQPSVRPRPSKLDQSMADVEHEYSQRIASARSSLKGSEKRAEVKRLKESRDAEIDLLKKNYYKSSQEPNETKTLKDEKA